MRRRFFFQRLVAVCLILIFSCNAYAAFLDLKPPSWRTDPCGAPPTTFQGWTFSTSSHPSAPDEVVNTYGNPIADVCVVDTVPPFQTYWKEWDPVTGSNQHHGVWRIYGDDYMKLTIPNADESNPVKEVWLQITYSSSDVSRKPELQTMPWYDSIELIDSIVLDDLYYHDTFLITIKPNPDSEDIYILPRDCTLYIDEIVVDTQCIPEPTTICLLSFGILGLLRRRRL